MGGVFYYSMSEELKTFIEQNINLIEKDTKESWELIYDKLPLLLTGEFTEAMLICGIDPAKELKNIPNNYLYYSNIDNYIIPNTVEVINSSAFSNCNNLTSIEVPDNVDSLYEDAFAYCNNLKTISLAKSVTFIGHYAFANCPKLKEIKYDGAMLSWSYITKGDYIFSQSNPKLKITCIDGVLDRNQDEII